MRALPVPTHRATAFGADGSPNSFDAVRVAVQDRAVEVGSVSLQIVRDSTVPAPVDRTDRRDRFRAAVVALDPGPLQEVLTAVAYARDEAARARSSTVPAARWSAVVAAAERAVAAVDAGSAERRVAVPADPRAVVA